MNPYLKTIEDLLLRHNELTPENREALLKAIADADKQWTITEFKLDRTEKVKKTTAVLLEETIEELEQKRKAVEAQNRELEIETALERVRSVAMGMKEPADMLDVCKAISSQLESLQVKEIRNVQTAVFDESKGIYTNYEFYARHDKLLITETEFRNHPIAETFANQMLKGPNEVFIHGFKGNEVKDWLNYQKSTNVFIDTYLETADSLIYYWYSLGPVALGISTYAPLNEEEINLFKRFRNVFELAYRRYIDIEQAQAQARESQIQLALERVRARTMAMRKSDELSEAVYLLFQQFRELGENPDQATIGVINEKEYVIEYWVTMYGNQMNKEFKFSIDEPYVTNKIYNAWKEGKKSIVIDLSGEALSEFMAYRAGKGGAAVNPNEKRRIINVAFFSKGLLNVQSNEQRSGESIRLLERFAAVFEQTYTRFLDLQKAEAQAREAQIELALERVRARTMAMQKSDELQEVVHTVFERLKDLNVELYTAIIVIFTEGSNDIVWWMQNKVNQQYSKILIRYADIPYLRHLLEAREKGEEIFSKCYINGEKNELYDYLFEHTDLRHVPDEQKKFLQENEFAAMSVALARNIGIHITSYSKKSFSDSENEILKRFAKVFDQSYTRFLDLQKAEAQAREAQIEAALEKVRSTSLAMHYSDELEKVVVALFDKLVELGLSFDGAFIYLSEKEKRNIQIWVATKYLVTPVRVNLPYSKELEENQIIKDLWSAIERGESFFNKSYSGNTKNEYFSYTAKHNEFIPEEIKIFQLEAKSWTASFVGEKNSVIGFDSWEGQVTTYDDFQILKRFAKVFEQSYTRFLDLQRAEGQAREAQIEAGLERVRARAMAMHTSAELSETSSVLFHELKKLGIKTIRSGFGVFNEHDETSQLWLTTESDSKTEVKVIGGVKASAHLVFQEFYDVWKQKKPFCNVELSGQELKDYYSIAKTYFNVPVPDIYNEREYYYCFYFGEGTLNVITIEPLSQDDLNILLRFANVFGLLYTRFLDLEKAEGQAREARIEAALERVRSRTMGMQKSDELKEIIQLVCEQLAHLEMFVEHAGFIVDYKARDDMHIWLADQYQLEREHSQAIGSGSHLPFEVTIPYFDCAHWNSFNEAKEKGINFFANRLSFEEKNKFYEDLFKLVPSAPKEALEYYFNCPGLAISTVLLDDVGLYIENFSGIPYSEEENNILIRFGKVFQQTYTRFLDLQKAEAQAREAEIQLALERVRARSLAMHQTSELQDVVNIVAQQLYHINIDINGGVFITVNSEVGEGIPLWASAGATDYVQKVVVPFLNEPIFICLRDAIKQRSNLLIEEYSREEKIGFFNHLFNYPPWNAASQERKQELLSREGGYARSVAVSSHTSIAIINHNGRKFNDGDNEILKRFGNVFEQSYTRFLDLQKAEAQAREARIEAALEKVRSRTMAMHKSEELSHVIMVVSEQLQQLQFRFSNVSFIINNAEYDLHFWSAAPWQPQPFELHVPFLDHISVNNLREAQAKGLEFFTDILTPEENNQWIHHMIEHSVLKQAPDDIKNYLMSRGAYARSFALMKHITLVIGNYEGKPYTDEENSIFRRFANVFEQSYTRFLDLKKAEAQAREAKIEAALEKVRGKAMAMHNSNDLSVTASMVLTELRKLGITPMRCGVGLLNKESRKAQLYSASSSAEGDNLSLVGWVMLSGHPVLEKIHDTWLKNEEYYPELSGEQLKTYYESLLKGLPVKIPDSENGQKQYGTFLPFSVGCLYAWSDDRYDEDQTKILKRFATIIDLTFRRYLELQQSEANAREAVKQAALDRIRADIASMRTTNDLDRITPLIWSELTILGIPFIRCGVFIMDESQKLIHTFLSTPDGNAIAAFHMPYDTPGNIAQVVSHWQDKKNYIDHWNEKAFTEFADTLVKQGALVSSEQYLQTIPQGGSYLHFLPFLQGMLYVGNTSPLSEDEIRLIQSVADAFSTAYARYEDFNKLEAAKKQVEKTLVVLKQAQQQLVQSEKMASLGELTAGIAHEIQNPLNFVNNFSEVSNELLDEMKTELEQGDAEEAKAIAADVKQNLEKILFHGKRADAIVKGMLQHSRSSSGQKEETDLNILADEYLRLAYHGLRAKDKSFNAKFETDLDSNVGKVNIVPQDIGRVILNLINNAFYAVSEKRKQNLPGYEPTVTVTTKKLSDKVELRVVDNGDGIPQKVMDKIFQPFFTTKPTGQGTGLGLSLSYDIIRAHGGEIRVETKEGERSEFVIVLPL